MYRGAWRLPDLQAPIDVPPFVNPDILCLIPLFRDDYTRVANIEAWVRYAIYSRWSCLKYTDAILRAVEIKFFVEDILADRVIPTFEKNFVDIDNDVIWFTSEPLEESKDGSWGFLGRQMIPYWDERFAGYEWLWVWDADILFMPNESTRDLNNPEELLPNKMFTHTPNLPKQAGYLHISITDNKDLEAHLLHKLALDIEKSGISVDALLEMSGVSTQRTTILKPACSLWAYPAKHYHTHHKDFIEWMRTYAPYWGNDEIIAGYWTQKFGLDVTNLYKGVGILTNDLSYYFRSNPPGNILHGVIKLEFENELRELLEIA